MSPMLQVKSQTGNNQTEIGARHAGKVVTSSFEYIMHCINYAGDTTGASRHSTECVTKLDS